MRISGLVELATLLATHGPTLVRCESRLSERSIECYWTKSRCRLERWSRAVRTYTRLSDRRIRPPSDQDEIWLGMRGQIEEILVSEVLTRIWTAVACALDRYNASDVLGPTARSIMINHLETRHHVLRLLVHPTAMADGEAQWLDRLRRRAERWTDLLVGRLTARGIEHIHDAACNPERSCEFANEIRYEGVLESGSVAWAVMVTSLRTAFGQECGEPSPNEDLNAQIATSILACFPPEMFDSVGLVKSLWQVRLNNNADDVEGLLRRMSHL